MPSTILILSAVLVALSSLLCILGTRSLGTRLEKEIICSVRAPQGQSPRARSFFGLIRASDRSAQARAFGHGPRLASSPVAFSFPTPVGFGQRNLEKKSELEARKMSSLPASGSKRRRGQSARLPQDVFLDQHTQREYFRQKLRLPVEVEVAGQANEDPLVKEFGPNVWEPWKDITVGDDDHDLCDGYAEELTETIVNVRREWLREEIDKSDFTVTPEAVDDVYTEEIFPQFERLPMTNLSFKEEASPFLRLPKSVSSRSKETRKLDRMMDEIMAVENKITSLTCPFVSIDFSFEKATKLQPPKLCPGFDATVIANDEIDVWTGFQRFDLTLSWNEVMSDFVKTESDYLAHLWQKHQLNIMLVQGILSRVVDTAVADGVARARKRKKVAHLIRGILDDVLLVTLRRVREHQLRREEENYAEDMRKQVRQILDRNGKTEDGVCDKGSVAPGEISEGAAKKKTAVLPPLHLDKYLMNSKSDKRSVDAPSRSTTQLSQCNLYQEWLIKCIREELDYCPNEQKTIQIQNRTIQHSSLSSSSPEPSVALTDHSSGNNSSNPTAKGLTKTSVSRKSMVVSAKSPGQEDRASDYDSPVQAASNEEKKKKRRIKSQAVSLKPLLPFGSK